MPSIDFLETFNGEPVDLGAIPVHPWQSMRPALLAALEAGGRMVALFGRPAPDRS
jgi:hypothetical protein